MTCFNYKILNQNSLKLFPIKIGRWLKSLICKYVSFWYDDAEKAHAGLVEGKQISTDQFLPFKVLGSFLQYNNQSPVCWPQQDICPREISARSNTEGLYTGFPRDRVSPRPCFAFPSHLPLPINHKEDGRRIYNQQQPNTNVTRNYKSSVLTGLRRGPRNDLFQRMLLWRVHIYMF